MKMVFDERFGEIPVVLARLMRKANVSPADFYAMEYMNMSHSDMLAHIKENTINGQYVDRF